MVSSINLREANGETGCGQDSINRRKMGVFQPVEILGKSTEFDPPSYDCPKWEKPQRIELAVIGLEFN